MNAVHRFLGPALAIATLAIVVWRLGTGPFVDGLKAVDARAVLAVAAVVLVTTFFSAWRWTIVARGLGVRLSLSAAVVAYYRAIFLNLTLPTGVAGDVHRGVSHGREVDDLGRGLRAVVWERSAGQVVQIVFAITVLLVLPSPVRSSMPFVAVAVLAVCLGIVLVGRARGGASRWGRIRTTVVADVRNGVLRRAALPAVVVASVVVAVGHVVTLLIAARTAGTTGPLSRLLPLAVLVLLATALPNVGGWGPREGVTAWVFAAAGLGAALGAATAVTYGVLVLAASLPGAAVLVAGWLPGRRGSEQSGNGSALTPEGASDG